jgi:hypothetical protein
MTMALLTLSCTYIAQLSCLYNKRCISLFASPMQFPISPFLDALLPRWTQKQEMFVTSTRLKFRALAAIFQIGAARNMMLIITSSKKTRLLSRDALSKRTTSQSGRRQHVSNISCFVLDRDYALAQWDSINILLLETNSLAELITVSSNISQPLLQCRE